MKPVARILRGTPRNLKYLASRLRSGALVAVPTETVYGLAADATNRKACRRIFAAKGRPSTDPLIVHIASVRDLARVAVPNAAALTLARKFWPGPLTLVLPKTDLVPDIVTSDRPSVAVRSPAHPLFRRLIRLAGRPLAVPSANPFGYVSPTTAEHVRQGLGGKIRHILDGGPSRIGLESTIVDLRRPDRPALLRPGAITQAQISRALRRPVLIARRPAASRLARGHLAPGQMTRHYSPHTPVRLHARITAKAISGGSSNEAWLLIARPSFPSSPNVFWLDARGNLKGAARNLFAVLRRLDESAFQTIHAELASGDGLAEALNDRLRRASAAPPPARAGTVRSAPRSRR